MMGDADFAWANALRSAHFPPERNVVPAHIALFHHLPPARLDELVRVMRRICIGRPPSARLSRVYSLGRGVAYSVESPDLLAIHADIADHFRHDLIPQDSHPPHLHITIQNKVDPRSAKALLTALAAEFRPRPLRITGLAAWHYLGGPWRLAQSVKFRGG